MEGGIQGERRSSIGYVPALDGLRGFAVLLVVGFHAFNWPRNGGAIGVGLFFVLSGFLITSLLLKEYDSQAEINLRAFYARRALRLFPLLYLALAVIALSLPFFASSAERSHTLSSLAYCAAYVGDFYGVLSHSNELAKATAHLWSLAVEEQFYLVWPATLLLVMRRRGAEGLLRFIAIGIVGAVVIRFALLAAGKTIWTLPTTYADALLAGCAISVLVRRGSLSPIIASRHLTWMGSAVVLVSLFLATILQSLRGGIGYVTIETFGVVLLLCALASTGAIPSLLRTRPLVYCGRVSYGVYVIHTIVSVAVSANISHGHSGWRWGVFSTVLTFAIAAASRRWFESYFLRIKDRRYAHPALTGPPTPV